ncbi:MAG: 23S rRNA (guanosine(2251)-2'-O)-methyltransferase RlmB [Ruminococcaceae bacterium]|nr:23S rRNA (guanosine(2251)-2'-O)-methyltransferase RlmB [Oscillospiraceae bacterium]
MKFYDNKKEKKQFDTPAPLEGPDENIICGRNAVLELIRSGRSVDKLFVKQNDIEGSIIVIIAEAKAHGIPIVEVKREKLDEMAMGVMHQGVIAMAAAKEYVEIEDILAIAESRGEKPFIVIADSINDPHNLGALIRNCEGAGVHGLIIPKRRSAGLTPVAARASAGAVEHLAIAKVSNLSFAINDLKKKGLWIVGCEAGGQQYDTIDYDMPLALVLGSEGEGISDLVKKNCDFIASIPMKGKVNSLNVSCASAVVLFEVAKARR